MGLIELAVIALGVIVGVAIYQIVKSKKAVTVASVETAVKADAAAVKVVADADAKKL